MRLFFLQIDDPFFVWKSKINPYTQIIRLNYILMCWKQILKNKISSFLLTISAVEVLKF
jgi:hypothetical protein